MRSPHTSTSGSRASASVEQWVRIGHLSFEKCELDEARIAFAKAFALAKKGSVPKDLLTALTGLLRFAGESQEESKLKEWSRELDRFAERHGEDCDPLYWMCRGHIAHFRGEFKLSQKAFTRAYHAHRRAKASPDRDRGLAITMILMMRIHMQLGHARRARYIGEVALRRFENAGIRGILGSLYYALGSLDERAEQLPLALEWYKKAHGAFLSEHNWFHHLYVLLGYARLARRERRIEEARWTLDLIEKACTTKEFAYLMKSVSEERALLGQTEIDLVVEEGKGLVTTRERTGIPIGKQYILIEILKELMRAHGNGLTKAQLIERVWQEPYRPEAHDNKLYYNINRLRKLIEPDLRKPKYLMNWKEGYRLHPELKVRIETKRGMNA